jgi:hypothetical protein
MARKSKNLKATESALSDWLERLIGKADEQTQLFESSIQTLYLNLAEVYLWWREARKHDGFLEKLYSERNLIQRGSEEKFTRLVSLVWQIDWSGHEAPKLQNWARALRGLHHEFETNTAAYSGKDASERMRQFFNSMGGIGAVGKSVSPPQELEEETAVTKQKSPQKKKSPTEELNDQQIRAKHIELGETHFSAEPPYIKNIATGTKRINVTRKGYAVALVRRTVSGGFDILSVTNNDVIVRDVIVDTYRRVEDSISPILRTIAETIKTQTLPLALERHRSHLSDITTVLAADGKTKLKSIKRLLFRPKSKDILLSECRTDCSVVTIAKPIRFPSNLSEDASLRSVNHRYVEQNMLQTRDLCFFTTTTKKLEQLADESLKATYRLQTKNTVTNKIHNLYFYNITSFAESNRVQADLDRTALGKIVWSAKVSKLWIQELHSTFVSNWLREFGTQINRDRNKQILISLSSAFEISFDGTRGNFTKTESGIPKPSVARSSKSIDLFVRSKDFFTVFDSLNQQQIQSQISIAANENVIIISYHTDHASYDTAIPTCNNRGHLNRAAFKLYGGVL